MIKLLIICILSLTVFTAIRQDIVHRVPGYADTFQTNVYAGYLNTSDPSRRLHYVFIQSVNNVNNSDPVTLWLHGGPGCSSHLGFLSHIGPFYIQEGKNYTKGDNLTQNKHSWHQVSNLLFIQSPAGVGYSINTNSSFQYNDLTTMQDNFAALRYFFTYYPEYSKNHFWIAGQSYAGKYIPDLAFKIDHWNLDHSTPENEKINLQGIFIGNGVIGYEQLRNSEVQYMIDHEFIDPQLINYWTNACQVDAKSAGCKYFTTRFDQNVNQVNSFNVYSYCYYNDSFSSGSEKKKHLSPQSIILNIAKTSSDLNQQQKLFKLQQQNNGVTCLFLDGQYQYFKAHAEEFHSKSGKQWNGPCAKNVLEKYLIDSTGSTNQYRYLLTRNLHIILYSGDWDSVIPYTDTIKNLERLNLQQSYLYTPLFLNEQHIGFSQIYSGGLNFVVVKGGSHAASLTKREAVYHLFQTAVKSHGYKEQQEQ